MKNNLTSQDPPIFIIGGFFMLKYIYKIENKINGKCYIGKTKNLEKRLKQHKNNVGKKRHKFYDAIYHYGWDNFLVEIIDSTEEKIDELEIYYINKFNSINEGYNYTIGGTGGDTFSFRDENSKNITIKKIREKSRIIGEINSDKHRENTKKLWKSEEYRIKVIEGIKKTIETEEYKKNFSNSMKNALKNPNIRKKWSDVKKGSSNSRWLGYILVYDINGNEIGRYETAVDASKDLKIPAHTIRTKARNDEPYKCLKKNKELYGIKFKIVNQITDK